MSLPKGLKGKLVYQTNDQAEILALTLNRDYGMAKVAEDGTHFFEYTEDLQKLLAALPTHLEQANRFLTAYKAMEAKAAKKPAEKKAGAPKKSGGNAKTKASLEVRAEMGLAKKGKVSPAKQEEFNKRVAEKLAKKS